MQNRETGKSLKESFERWPLSVILLPLFFIIHGVKENFASVQPKDYLPILLFYCLCSTIVYLFFLWIYRNGIKAALITFILFCIFFFYGATQDFLKQISPALTRYVVLIPVFLIIAIIFGIYLKRSSSNFVKANKYLNYLFIILIVVDVAGIINQAIYPTENKLSVYSSANNLQERHPCDSCSKPDIYFLLFDEYASSSSLKDDFHYDNGQLDSFFVQKRFRIQKESFSNYNYTPFSMASLLNMSYLKGITDGMSYTNAQYYDCFEIVKQSEVAHLFSYLGYNIVNYSIFDLPGNPTRLRESLFTAKTRLITDQTLWGRIQKQILWNLVTGKFKIQSFADDLLFEHLNVANKTFDLLNKETAKKNATPKFVYAHFMIPHPPFYFDSAGTIREKSEIMNEKNDRLSYLNSVRYINEKIYALVNTIQKNTQGKAAIIVMGDHGFRYDQSIPRHSRFKIQNAVYLPDQNYSQLYDSISAVNQFRVVANTLFKQNLPLLNDSTVYLMGSLH